MLTPSLILLSTALQGGSGRPPVEPKTTDLAAIVLCREFGDPENKLFIEKSWESLLKSAKDLNLDVWKSKTDRYVLFDKALFGIERCRQRTEAMSLLATIHRDRSGTTTFGSLTPDERRQIDSVMSEPTFANLDMNSAKPDTGFSAAPAFRLQLTDGSRNVDITAILDPVGKAPSYFDSPLRLKVKPKTGPGTNPTNPKNEEEFTVRPAFSSGAKSANLKTVAAFLAAKSAEAEEAENAFESSKITALSQCFPNGSTRVATDVPAKELPQQLQDSLKSSLKYGFARYGFKSSEEALSFLAQAKVGKSRPYIIVSVPIESLPPGRKSAGTDVSSGIGRG